MNLTGGLPQPSVAGAPLVFIPRAAPASGQDLGLSMTRAIEQLLAANAVVAVGVSGGKDGTAAALQVNQHLNRIGHTGPRVLVHADLGRVEWKDSLPSGQRPLSPGPAQSWKRCESASQSGYLQCNRSPCAREFCAQKDARLPGRAQSCSASTRPECPGTPSMTWTSMFS